MSETKKTRKIKLGNIYLGGNSEILIQTMLKDTPTNIDANIKKTMELENAGCNILRVAVPNIKGVNLISNLKEKTNMPIVADIHFDYKLALESVNAGADKIRINPGNIGDESRVLKIVKACQKRSLPIRVGVNSGSLPTNYKKVTPEALCETALNEVKILNKFNFFNIVISVKSSDVLTTIKAYRMLNKQCDYPLHIGITEVGLGLTGIIKNTCAIGSLLTDKIGNTIRYTLTEDPIKEVIAAKELLSALNIKKFGIEFISCPTCGRTKANIFSLIRKLKKYYENNSYSKSLKVAVMGCAVNGPGEARQADLGVVCGDKEGLLFKNSKIYKKVREEEIFAALVKEIDSYAK